MKKTVQLISVLFIIAIFFTLLTACGVKHENPTLTINFAGGNSGYEGTVVIELYPDKAPNTVNNIIYLVKQGYFDGLKVNMAVANRFIEIADGTGFKTLKETGAPPDYAIKGEFSANGYDHNNLQFEKGSVAMSRYERSDYDSATDGFFITLGQFPEAQNEFAIFGKIISGIEIIEDISNMKVTESALHYEPLYSVKIESAAVALKGIQYDLPETIGRTYYTWNSYNPWWAWSESSGETPESSPGPSLE